MTISMYQASIPVFNHMFKNLIHIMEKGAAFAKEKDIEEPVLLEARLAPDMFPFKRQIQIATDVARRGIARLAGDELESVEDNEASFAELCDRVRSTIARLESYSAEQIDGTEEKSLTVELPNHTLQFNGQDFLLTFIIPNIYFHISTAYDLLRHNGVELGKADYLGKIGI